MLTIAFYLFININAALPNSTIINMCTTGIINITIRIISNENVIIVVIVFIFIFISSSRLVVLVEVVQE